jgi:two-component system nitrate/nitrite response regulator NarL
VTDTTAAWLPGARLSGREIEVVSGFANGLSYERIGELLHISPETVKSHAVRSFRKLGAADRAHAVALAIATRQIEPQCVAVVIPPAGA